MDNTLLLTIIIAVAAAIAGFILAWMLKKSHAAKAAELASGLDQAKNQLTAKEAETAFLQQERAQQLQRSQELENGLMQSRQQAAAFHSKLESLLELQENIRQERLQEKQKHDDVRKELIQATNELHRTRAQLAYKDEQLARQQTQLEQIGHQFSKEFQVLAQQVLDEKTKSFHLVQEKSLTDLLHPLRENIQNFKQEFETKYKTESDDRISLREQIRHMMALNQTLSTQANNLTNALRGQVKHQGNWGEMILESILQHADLKKGIHYFTQELNKGEEGQNLLPDVIVKYPDGRKIVIDSKVSLLHYEQFCSAEEEGAQRLAINLLQQSFTKHIEGLSSKNYAEATGALDFVMLFVPVEGAYITIMQSNPQLWNYAYKKRVLLISPTNLIAAMKLVYDLWKKDGINQNAQQVADKAVRIYEKLAAFVEDFEKIGTILEKASGTFNDARKKLHTGKGNLINLASQMKANVHHTKPQRELPASLLDEAEKFAEPEEETASENFS